MTKYLVTIAGESPSLQTDLILKIIFIPNIGMVVYDLNKGKYTDDGKTWKDIQVDFL